ncbi:RNAse P Rpr2/Rpp21/SNM1 subunit domain-containing protein, partial [Delphinella strobiligena]
AKGVPNKHVHARIAYLNKVATYLALQQSPKTAENTSENANDGVSKAVSVENTNMKGLPYLFTSHLRAVSRKSQISLSHDMKRSLCKVCSAPLVPGQTSAVHMQNASKGGKKPWANIQVIRCLNCDTNKRFPLGALRQRNKSERKS